MQTRFATGAWIPALDLDEDVEPATADAEPSWPATCPLPTCRPSTTWSSSVAGPSASPGPRSEARGRPDHTESYLTMHHSGPVSLAVAGRSCGIVVRRTPPSPGARDRAPPSRAYPDRGQLAELVSCRVAGGARRRPWARPNHRATSRARWCCDDPSPDPQVTVRWRALLVCSSFWPWWRTVRATPAVTRRSDGVARRGGVAISPCGRASARRTWQQRLPNYEAQSIPPVDRQSSTRPIDIPSRTCRQQRQVLQSSPLRSGRRGDRRHQYGSSLRSSRRRPASTSPTS